MNIHKKHKHCVFCNTPINNKNRGKEHVFPLWLLKYLKIENVVIEPTHFTKKMTVVSTRKHTLNNLLAGEVCSACNNGWMSHLEDEAMPILKLLIKGEITIIDLDDKKRQILARWCAKTAYCLNLASNYLKNIPKDHFEFIKNDQIRLPKKVYCYAQQHNGNKPFYWMQGGLWLTHGIEKDEHVLLQKIKENNYKISLLFGKLLLVIAYLPKKGHFPVIWKGIHVPLLPKKGRIGYYDKEKFPWHDSEEALFQFHFGLQLVRGLKIASPKR